MECAEKKGAVDHGHKDKTIAHEMNTCGLNIGDFFSIGTNSPSNISERRPVEKLRRDTMSNCTFFSAHSIVSLPFFLT